MNKPFDCWEPLHSEAETYLASCLDERNFSDNAKELFAKRYYVPYFDTSTNEMNKESKLDQLIKRVGRIVASGLVREFNTQNNWLKIKSSDYDDACLKEKFLALMKIVEFNIRKDVSLKRFLFNSPALFSSGVGLVEKEMSSRIIYDVKVEDMTFSNYEYLYNNKSPYQQMCACFVIDVDDDLDSIFNSVKEAAIISKHGGGVGCNWSSLREKNAPIKDGSIGNSSGPVSFMELWNTMGKVVVQGGKRRSAIMSMMDVDHPDIQEFVHAKEHDGSLQYFNISTRLDNEFINAVKQKKPYYLKSRLGKDVNLSDGIKREMKLTQIDANELFDEICTCAHKNGEPGIIFGDKINQDNLLKHLPDWQIRATNPCVSGNTKVLTKDGFIAIKELVGKETTIWNGHEWSLVVPKITAHNQKMVRISAKSEKGDINSSVDCTWYHGFYIVYDNQIEKVEAEELEIGDTIAPFKLFGCFGNVEYIDDMVITGKEIIEDAETVYCFTEPMNHSGIFNSIYTANCGEQPLPTYTSCVLGSINLEAFINKNENNFSDYEFIRQIHRSILYLDCVVDANSYPLKKIEERTQDIRPLGLGFMGLANAAIKLKMGYGSNNFNQFCKYIGKLMAKHSMYASIDLCEVMEFTPFRYAKEAISHFNSELTFDDLPPSIKIIFNEQENKDEYRSKYLSLFLEGKLRNSRRLTIAPTGSISMLFDTSSGIEPNFAYQYDRRISKGHGIWETVQYTHPLYMTKEEYDNQKTSKDDDYEDVYIKANDLSIEKHMQPLKIFSKYIDSAISKTINLPASATVEDVKKIYLDAFDSSIKGVTVYRDGSRGSQPIVDTSKKEEKKENIGTLIKDNEHIYTGKVKERSQFMRSITTKMAVEPYGSIYLTATLDENGNIFEIFSSIGKSGQMLKTMMEALSRIISIALRSGTNIQDVIGTLKFMSGTDRWIYDTFDKKEIEVNSIPDMLARMLEDIQKHFTGTGEKLETIESKHQEELTIHGDICPECGKELSHYDGCKICWSCQYSACK